MVERQIVDLVVEGSNPFFHPLGCRFESCRAQETIGPLAQLVEQQTLNLRVKGSIPLRLRTHRESGGIGRHARFRF